MAPTIDIRMPAGWNFAFELGLENRWPMSPPTIDPTTPTTVVIKRLMWSAPGKIARAISPTMNPTIRYQIICSTENLPLFPANHFKGGGPRCPVLCPHDRSPTTPSKRARVFLAGRYCVRIITPGIGNPQGICAQSRVCRATTPAKEQRPDVRSVRPLPTRDVIERQPYSSSSALILPSARACSTIFCAIWPGTGS